MNVWFGDGGLRNDQTSATGEYYNAFIRDGERVLRTYLINNRGDETMGSTWSYLDIDRSGGTGTTTTTPRPRLTRHNNRPSRSRTKARG
jgi:predicted dithiol-disulfide oxidoreductase (DUF899 family)